MKKIIFILDKGLIFLFLTLFLISLLFPLYFFSQYEKTEKKEEGISLNEKEYQLFLKNLEEKEFIDFEESPFENLINEDF